MLFTYILVALGSALGGTARFWLAAVVTARIADPFPLGTLIINVTGSFAIGLFGALTGPEGRIFVPNEWRQFFMIGICGGYTTFSSFSLQTMVLAQDGEWLRAGLNIVGSVVLCLFGVWLGYTCAQLFNE